MDLTEAVSSGDTESIESILNLHPELVNTTMNPARQSRPSDAPDMRMLHLAVAENQKESLLALLRRGADPNARNAYGRLPVHDCLELGRSDLAQILFDHGAVADVCAASAFGLHTRRLDS